MLRRVWTSILVKQLMFAAAIVVGGLSPSASDAASLPPEALAEYNRMSTAEKKRLAEQYGVDAVLDAPGAGLDTRVDEQATEGIGRMGQPIQQVERGEMTSYEFSEELDLLVREEDDDLLGLQDIDAKAEIPLKRFGHDFFNRDEEFYEAVDTLPVLDGYLLGPGDTLEVLLFGKEQMQRSLEIDRDGKILFPRLGSIAVSGLSFNEAKDLIVQRVGEQMIGTEAVVSMGRLRSINVFIAGEVALPGNYSVSALATVTQALYKARGTTSIGSYRNIEVRRGKEVVAKFDLYDLLINGDALNDIRLISGDLIFVPVAEAQASISGAIRRPAIYELKAGDDLKSLITMAGGIESRGYLRQTMILRSKPGMSLPEAIQVDISSSEDLSTEVIDGDVIKINRVKDEVVNAVMLRGAVAREGQYAWRPGLRVVDLLSDFDADLTQTADPSIALLVRRTGRGLKIEALPVQLAKAIEQPTSEANLELAPKDELVVLGLAYADPNRRMRLVGEIVDRIAAQAGTPAETRLVRVDGEVRLPGTYPLFEGGTAADLIALAGGLEASAYLERVEITRLNVDAEGQASFAPLNVNMREQLALGAEGEKLQPRDQLIVRRIPNWSYGEEIILSGKVKLPGSYPISTGETIRSVVERAGGLEKEAFLEGAVLIKVEAQEREREQLRTLIRDYKRKQLVKRQTREAESLTGNAAEDGLQVQALEELLEEDFGGRVVIDLPRIIAGDAAADIVLQSGDSLYIPPFSNTVSVLGEVRQPGTHQYRESMVAMDYIAAAAGTTQRSRLKDGYLIRANGGVEPLITRRSLLRFNRDNSYGVRPGDTIVIPVNEDYLPALARYREVTSVIFQSMASIFPLLRL